MKYKTCLAVIKNHSIIESKNEKKLFQAASISKCLTSLCVMKLVQKGKLRLDKDVNNYLKDWKVRDKKGNLVKVTLKELLSHTAGISCSGFRGYKKNKKIPLINQILEDKKPANNEKVYQKYKKGTYHYSGGGYVIIQKILEDILEKSFNKIMEIEIFKPLKMTKSSFGSYKKIKGNVYPEKTAAGLWTTSKDLAKFIITIQKCYKGKSKFLSQKLTKQMLKPIIKAESNFMALGFFILKNKKQFYHAGHNVGYRSKFIADFKSNGVVVLTNQEDSMKEINKLIRKYLK